MATAEVPARVFISYSHKNLNHFQKLQSYLALYALNEEIFVWSDKDIAPGQDWDSAIKSAIHSSGVAVLLVSVEFLTSPYIRDVELPLLIDAADKQELRLIPIVLNACDYGRSVLGRFQAAHDVSRPMSKLSTTQRDDIWLEVAKRIREAMQHPSPVQGSVIRLLDLSPVEFENLMYAYLSKVYGEEANVMLTGARFDMGIDITLLHPDPIWGGKVIVLTKRYSPDSMVSAAVVRDIAEAVAHTGSSQGVILTTGKFSNAAIDHAQSSRVRLVDGELLVALLQQQGFNAMLT